MLLRPDKLGGNFGGGSSLGHGADRRGATPVDEPRRVRASLRPGPTKRGLIRCTTSVSD